MSELKPCPFCGGPVELERPANTGGSRQWWGVVCRNTINRGGTCAIEQRPSASREAAIDRWNMRRPAPEAATDSAVALTEHQLFELFHTARNAETRADFMRVAKDILAAGSDAVVAADAQRTDAVPSDTERLDFLVEQDARVARSRDGDVFHVGRYEDADGDLEWVRLGPTCDTPRQALDAAIRASRPVDAGNQGDQS